MSYEGYVVVYCVNGHKIGSFDIWDDSWEGRPCPVCGVMEKVTDSVDLTNGCTCTDDYKCSGHAVELEVLGYTEGVCMTCKGTGTKGEVTKYADFPCHCTTNADGSESKPKSDCPDCYGTGTMRGSSEIVTIDCPQCKGTGRIHVPRHCLVPLLKKDE